MGISDAVRCSIELDAAAARMHSHVEERPWGLLYHNASNPDHHDANIARRIRTATPDAVIAEIASFYRQRGLVPRVKIDNLTEPADFAERLRVQGWQCEHTPLRVMTWEGAARIVPPSSSDVAVVRASLADLSDFAQVQSEGFGHADARWILGFLVDDLAHPACRNYLARVDGEAASALSVFDTATVGVIINVATRPGFRGRGLASLLLAHAQADSRGPLLLEVTEDKAERVYRRAGFALRGFVEQRVCWLPRQAT